MIEALHGEDESHWAGRDAEVPPRRQTVDAQAISAAALSLFAERGYRATTMSDIGAAFGIRGPSPYRHVSSKQALLGEIMIETMRALIADRHAALDAGGDVIRQLRQTVDAHVRYHAAHREQAFVGNHEIGNLKQPHRDQVLRLRRTNERGLRAVIERGYAEGEFTVA
jgi:AcrR family transcriptional regulator